MNKRFEDTSNSSPGVADHAAGTDEDWSLIEIAQKGDTRAYDALVTRHRNKIFAMIRNMTHHEADAWDLSQEVFIKAWHALPRFESKAKFSTWLYRIAHNVVYDWNRKRKIISAGELNEEIFNSERIHSGSMTTPATSDEPDQVMVHGELRVKIEQALGKLSEEHREVVLLKDVQGLSYKEIADVMETTLGTVMSRLFYARQKLQTLLKDEYENR
ncbi:MAG: sigma-70 family RNA polymerase sigma factor [Verrucomicrobia bacterium]|nr:MAG: sigma-70 family RNA polymerase sigma factor [Verrucomicrobiota bacterium]